MGRWRYVALRGVGFAWQDQVHGGWGGEGACCCRARGPGCVCGTPSFPNFCLLGTRRASLSVAFRHVCQNGHAAFCQNGKVTRRVTKDLRRGGPKWCSLCGELRKFCVLGKVERFDRGYSSHVTRKLYVWMHRIYGCVNVTLFLACFSTHARPPALAHPRARTHAHMRSEKHP